MLGLISARLNQKPGLQHAPLCAPPHLVVVMYMNSVSSTYLAPRPRPYHHTRAASLACTPYSDCIFVTLHPADHQDKSKHTDERAFFLITRASAQTDVQAATIRGDINKDGHATL